MSTSNKNQRELLRPVYLRLWIGYVEMVLFVIVFLIAFIFGIPGEDWFYENMPIHIAVINLIYFFVFGTMLLTKFRQRIPFWLFHLLGLVFFVSMYFSKVSARKEPWLAWIGIILTGLIVLISKGRKRKTKD